MHTVGNSVDIYYNDYHNVCSCCQHMVEAVALMLIKIRKRYGRI